MTPTVRRRFLGHCLPWLVLVAGVLVFFGPSLAEHMARATHPYAVSDDMRIQLPHFYHYVDRSLFVDDPIGQYHSDGTGELFRWLYIGLGHFLDIVVIGKLLTYALWFLTAAGVAVAASRLAGKAAAFAAVCFVLGSSVFIDRVVGGLPRGFAYPALAWSAACLVSGRIRTLAVLTVLGAGFYPVIPVISGLSLALVLLVLPRHDRGSARHWSLKRRLVVLSLTVAGCGVVMAPFALRMRPYGEMIRPSDVAEFPEAGPGGRLSGPDQKPEPFFDVATQAARRTVFGTNRPLVPAVHGLVVASSALHGPLLQGLAWMALLGIARLGFMRRGRGVRRLAAFALAVFVGYLLASAVHPKLAPTERYPYMGVPLLVAILVPSALLGWLPRRLRLPGSLARFTAGAWVFSGCCVLLALVGCYGKAAFGWNIEPSGGERRMLKELARLPPSAVIAGFPKGLMDDVPLGAKRTAFIDYQMFMPYHQGMTRLMRERTRAVLDACYSRDLDALKRLRDQFGVTHFVFEPGGERRHRLFRPFGAEIQRRLAALKANDERSALASYTGDAIVFQQSGYVLLDLRKL